tara:strand:- start:3816 stop:4118 length:303 start_codon:yes stop_codon:yes gene_type:complete
METNEVSPTEECEDCNEQQKKPDFTKMSKQEQNWLLMTILQIPWHHANKIEDETDRMFLLDKSHEIQIFMQQQEQMRMQQQQMQNQQDIIMPPPSSIITP